MGSRGGSWWPTTAKIPRRVCPAQHHLTPRLPFPASFWSSIVGKSLPHFVSPVHHYPLACIGAPAVSHLISYLSLVLLLPDFKNFIDISRVMSFPLTHAQCRFMPLFLFLHCYFSRVWGGSESKHMFALPHLLGVYRGNFIKQQTIWVLPSSQHPSSSFYPGVCGSRPFLICGRLFFCCQTLPVTSTWRGQHLPQHHMIWPSKSGVCETIPCCAEMTLWGLQIPPWGNAFSIQHLTALLPHLKSSLFSLLSLAHGSHILAQPWASLVSP